jgi:hypothetical protein
LRAGLKPCHAARHELLTTEFNLELALGLLALGHVEDGQDKPADEVQPYAFDILTLDGEDLRPLPLSLRKTNLARLLARRPRVRQVRVPFGGTVLASVAGEQPRGPQIMRIPNSFAFRHDSDVN